MGESRRKPARQATKAKGGRGRRRTKWDEMEEKKRREKGGVKIIRTYCRACTADERVRRSCKTHVNERDQLEIIRTTANSVFHHRVSSVEYGVSLSANSKLIRVHGESLWKTLVKTVDFNRYLSYRDYHTLEVVCIYALVYPGGVFVFLRKLLRVDARRASSIFQRPSTIVLSFLAWNLESR